ncbi:raffinose/stachyose/melibiose transport system permease protein [Anaerocolumna jejuensis DSM 15929]|uniref:Raffinose/stachyose/melibiose transport system permease protein n=1 Tax=Anaerocolumna jejuensis DSM 15929 TaxID=1121322 RepID=A0A1M7BJ99_9FIRM|nr:sugar ABC transporter permease [Anaerocolumna jejuensis]SHL55092.1 raffinose/stachyose/melibiose transport system permease protein [Anaerocolumna jejuensis DSM 15929]
MINFRKSKKIGFLLVLPLTIFVLIYMVYPVIYNIKISFYDWNGIDPGMTFIGFKNYALMFKDKVFSTVVINFVLFAVFTVSIQAILGFFLADIFQKKYLGRDITKTVLFMPAMLSSIIIGQVFFRLLDPNIGYLKDILSFFGVSAPLSNPRFAIWTIIIINIWQWTGYSMTLYFGSMAGISEDLYEAAKIDGATHFQLLRKIILPMLRGTTYNLTIIGVIGALKQYDLVVSLTGGGPANATQTFATYLYKAAFTNYEQGYACAVAVVMFLIAGVITMLQLKLYNSKMV